MTSDQGTLLIALLLLSVVVYVLAEVIRAYNRSENVVARKMNAELRLEQERARQAEAAERKRAEDATRAEQAKAKAEQATAAAENKSEQNAARRHLAEFYDAHAHMLADAWPPALMKAFLQSGMPDTYSPAQLWAIAKDKIAELQPLIVEQKGTRSKERLEKRRRAAEIAACELAIERMKQSGGDEAEIRELHRQLRKLREASDQTDVVTPTDLQQ